jgi:hypothetical protein
LGSDPGLNRFRSAFMSVLTIGLILEAELLFVRFTDALHIQTGGDHLSAAAAAKTAAAQPRVLGHHDLVGAMSA